MTTLQTTRSAAIAERLRGVMPGGDTRTGTFYAPYPVVIERGVGCHVWDADGNAYIDCLGNFSSLIHGYGAPEIVAALEEQLRSGTAFAAPHELQAEVAERLRARCPSVEHVRYANSGSEAIILAIRAARAFTGRERIVKAAGGYHGFWEQVPMSPGAAGVPVGVQALLSEHEFNDVESLRAAVGSGEDVAAIILEPMLTAGGVIAGEAGYLQAARALADEVGALLVLDEIVTLRIAWGAYQSLVDVRPDITAFGKIIGGGLPVGAIGGRADVLAVFDPRRAGAIVHSGTFNGNALTLAAGRASLDRLTADEIARINALGARLGDGLRAGIPDAVVTQVGSMVQVHFDCSPPPLRRYRDVNLGSERLRRFHGAALERGVYLAARGLMVVSTPMDEAVIDEVVARLADAGAASL